MTVAELVQEKGVPQLAGRLTMSQTSIFNWLSFNNAPNVLTAAKIIRLSNGRCNFNSIYAPYVNAYYKVNSPSQDYEQLELFKD